MEIQRNLEDHEDADPGFPCRLFSGLSGPVLSDLPPVWPITHEGATKMTTAKRWDVHIFIDEDESKTRAEARLVMGDNTQLVGTGTARRNPRDMNVPEIGDELAVARALSELSHRLLHAAAEDIEGVTRQPAHLEA